MDWFGTRGRQDCQQISRPESPIRAARYNGDKRDSGHHQMGGVGVPEAVERDPVQSGLAGEDLERHQGVAHDGLSVVIAKGPGRESFPSGAHPAQEIPEFLVHRNVADPVVLGVKPHLNCLECST